MFLQIVLQLIPVVTAGIIAYYTYFLSIVLANGGAGAFHDLMWIVEATPALNTFLVFIAKAAYLVTIFLCALGRTSNHIVMSLDILYSISLLLLILYHALKQPDSLIKVA